MPQKTRWRGVVLALTSSVLFAGMFYYVTLLAPLGGETIFAWRLLLALPVLTVYLLVSGQGPLIGQLAARARRSPSLIAGLALSGGLLGVQQWLFLWAPLNGRGLQVALGYFVLPLTMLLAGRAAFGERLTALQKLAALAAAVGVSHELYRSGGLSWEILVVALGFPAYFILRRRLGADHLGGLWCDMVLLSPAALWLLSQGPAAWPQTGSMALSLALIGGLGLMSAAAFMAYTTASSLLPLGLFGLLGYVEPALMMAAALWLGETITSDQWATYAPIGLAIVALTLEGVLELLRANSAA